MHYKTLISNIVVIIVILFCFIFLGCDQGQDQLLDDTSFNKDPGSLEHAQTLVDSVMQYKGKTHKGLYTWSGNYKELSAFAIFNFSKPLTITVDDIDSLTIRFNVSSTWRDGSADFELYETVKDWPDSSQPDADMPKQRLLSTTSVADSITLIGSLDFTMPVSYLSEMEQLVTLMVAPASDNETMVSIPSAYSTYLPYFEMVENITEDSTFTRRHYSNSTESNYYFENGYSHGDPDIDRTGILSNANYNVVVIKLHFPESIPKTASVNGCLLPLHIESKIIADNSSMPLEVYRLENSFDSIEKSEFDGNSYIQAAIHDTTETLNIDISKYISVWLKDEDSNYGLMIKPYNNNNSLQQFKFSLPESLNVTYTTLPEIE